MASDSKFIDAIGFEGMLDVVGDWQCEQLPPDDIVAGVSGSLPLPLDSDGEDIFDSLAAAERERKELEWHGDGPDLLEPNAEDDAVDVYQDDVDDNGQE